MRDTLFCVLSVLVSLALAIVSLRYVTDYWLLAFVYSFQIHIALACLAVALLALLVKRHWYGMFLVATCLVLAGHGIFMLRQFANGSAPLFARTAVAADSGHSYRLVSFNIWNTNLENGAKIADAIIASKADVVFVLESMPLLGELSRISQTYPYRIGCGVEMSNCDLMMLSKRPFLTKSVQTLGGIWSDRFILTSVDLDGQPVNFAAAHLTKPYFDEFHTVELERLSGILSETKGPLILAGDFNSSILAPDMQNFLRTDGLRNAFPEPATWPIEAGRFGIAIDHVFARPPVTLKSVSRIDNMGSNHYGLVADFTIAGETPVASLSQPRLR
ncbi:endonuclease/exonuclease/phosphatase family protein [Rhizobium sp. BK251]|uniref:endonuclease/exonuclease/phosphatase family protein n=1 Tax=Rhizobium sp. BK251 TaxID=2512125 RepID=UPI001043D253|nr:endonuclease/exonuclease/phosphatase family protein [Rhizobium sp. BK251]TCL74750.1 endonuclease/exonuclease/phosphatase (EEP) superfamily protein YafD [Rhizobium sp. BK251]